MKKYILYIILFFAFAITLFFYLSPKPIIEEKNKLIKKAPLIETKKTKAPIKKEKKVIEVPKKEIKINLDPEITINRNERYKNEQYSKPASIEEVRKSKEKDLDINFDVDIDKKNKEIDGFKIDIEKKF